MPRKRKEELPQGPPRPCEQEGCTGDGQYRAPKSPGSRAYRWLCLEHVREHNQQWDYFKGMSMEEIEHFRKEAVTGHRPTWKISDTTVYDRQTLEDALLRMLGEPQKKSRHAPMVGLNQKDRKALAVLGIEDAVSKAEIKKRYKALVKLHHPDVNKGNKESEEKFKRITEAYKYLMQHYKPPV